jgi:predicted anti-sigma-YlaC factor YlaD
MMNCEQVTRLAGEFLERRLRLRQRLEMLVHLAMCRGCREYVEQFRLTLIALRAAPKPAAESVPETLMDHFRRTRRPPGG